MAQRERNLKKPKREVPVLNRKESQAQTRARLIAVGREHFVRFGMGGASVAKIAAEAGFTRGALYANFQNIEELFVAVLQSGSDQEQLTFQSVLASSRPAQERFLMLREVIGARMQNSAWIVLQAEFQANALHSPMIREAFLEQQARRRKDGAALLREFTSQLGLVLSASPEEIVALLVSLSEGLAMRQAVSGVLELEQARQLSLLCFDRLVTWGLPGERQE